MPKYIYYCNACTQTFEQVHSMTITLEDCHFCGDQDSLVRVPSTVRLVDNDLNAKSASGAPGEIVKQHIEEARQDIKEERESMSREYES